MKSIFITITALVAVASATKVSNCKGSNIPNLEELVTLESCSKIPCRLKRGTNQIVNIKLTPEKDLAEVKTHVTAKVTGSTVPFAGVDGNSVCNKMFNEDGSKASCPLKAGNNYVYKDSFLVENFYPKLISTVVHWALQDADGNDQTCFEVKARID